MRSFYIVLAALVGVAIIRGDAESWNWFLHDNAWDISVPVLAYFVVQVLSDV